MSVTSPPSTHSVEYHLANQDAGITVRVIVNKLGTPVRFFYRDDDGLDFGFQTGDITSVTTDDGLRASVSFDVDGVPGPFVRFEVLLPVIAFGPDIPGLGPFGIFAAGLRIERFPDSGEPAPGPKQAIEAFALPGRALAYHPEDDA